MAASSCSFPLILPPRGSEEKGSLLQLQTAQLQVSSIHFLTGRGHQRTNLPKSFPLQEHSQESPVRIWARMNLWGRLRITLRQPTGQFWCLLQVFKTLIWFGQVGNFTTWLPVTTGKYHSSDYFLFQNLPSINTACKKISNTIISSSYVTSIYEMSSHFWEKENKNIT